MLDQVRRSPDAAVFVGAHRRAGAVLVSVEQYEALQELATLAGTGRLEPPDGIRYTAMTSGRRTGIRPAQGMAGTPGGG
ncbi:MAG: hypothetical protein ABSB76_38235, partial [Streptosporangiaceae bacterium]